MTKSSSPDQAPVSDRFAAAFGALGNDLLNDLCEDFELPVTSKATKAERIAALWAMDDTNAILLVLRRDDLKAMCRALALDDSGREKEPIVARLRGALRRSRAAAKTEEGPEAPASAKAPRGKKVEAASLALEGEAVAAYRHEATRKNNPPAGLVEFDKPPKKKKKEYAYDPHLDPQLQWAGKAERTSFEVDTVSLHIHERISTQAILRAVKREEQQMALNLFAKPDLPQSKEIDFYAHEVGWSNRLVLGDSLLVMNSLLERENMAGQVQCVFMDPPYGVKFNSNFQPSISRRDVKDGDDASLTREPEQIQAYRDTWDLGVHSYLSYLRDRILVARDLLADSGSIFVQISEENVHHVREILDEVFGPACFQTQIVFMKTTGKGAGQLDSVYDMILWYSRSETDVKYRPIYVPRGPEEDYNLRMVEWPDGRRERLGSASAVLEAAGKGARVFRPNPLTSARARGPNDLAEFTYNGRRYSPGMRTFSTDEQGLRRLARANRLIGGGNTLSFVRYLEDFPLKPIHNVWDDTRQSGFGEDKMYVVQTSPTAIERCVLMTTDPGDVVLDPTCGSGTSAIVAEQWGRRWITCDTSRVAVSLARQRLLTARFPFYQLRSSRIRDGFRYQTVPHITLKSIAQNSRIDSAKSMDEIERIVRDSGDQEVLYDQPYEDKSKVRVSGPFTVEGIPLASMEDPTRDVDGATSQAAAVPGHFSDEVNDYLQYMQDLLKKTGVQFPGNKRIDFPNLAPLRGNFEWVHAEGHSNIESDKKRYAISFGPRHGPVTATQVMEGTHEARGFDVLLFFGFACDPEARRIIDQGSRFLELHFVNAAPDILVGDLLKKKKTDQLFTVFGAPDVVVHKENGGSMVSIELTGVDIYDPTTGTTSASKGADAAAIFVDHDYDGKSFCVSQALFPGGGNNAWEKLQKALKGSIDEDKFEQLRTTRSLPFKPGHRVAVKVIDDRGNEVIKLVDPRKAL